MSVKTHGKTESAEYNSWMNMRGRCKNPNNDKYKWYGAIGIKVCDRWTNSFENFLADMGEKTTPKHSLDRINVHGNYEPTNCRWATQKEQCNNKRSNMFITANGITKTLYQWSEFTGIKWQTIRKRIKMGWTENDAISVVVKKYNFKQV